MYYFPFILFKYYAKLLYIYIIFFYSYFLLFYIFYA